MGTLGVAAIPPTEGALVTEKSRRKKTPISGRENTVKIVVACEVYELVQGKSF